MDIDGIYTNLAKHLYNVRIKGTSLEVIYPTIELAYARGYLGNLKPYNDVWIKIFVTGESEKFLFKINVSDKDWFKDLNSRVAHRLGVQHVTVVIDGKPLNEYTLYNVVHGKKKKNTIYSVEFRQASVPLLNQESSVNAATAAASSMEAPPQLMIITSSDFTSIIHQFLENALIDLSKHINDDSTEDTSIEDWIAKFSNTSRNVVFDFIFGYYKTYQVEINDITYRLPNIIGQQQQHHQSINATYLVNSFIKIAYAFTLAVLDDLNAKRSLQNDKKAAMPIIQTSIKTLMNKFMTSLVLEPTLRVKREELDRDDNQDEEEEEEKEDPLQTQLRFIGVKFNVPLPSLRKTTNALRNTKNIITNATSKSKYVEFSLTSSIAKGRVASLVQNVLSEVEPGDILRYRVLPSSELNWVRVDIEEKRADYRGEFSKSSWQIVTSNKIRRPSSVAFEAPYMTFPLAWAMYRVRTYVERKDAPGRWKLEGERNFNCSTTGGKTGNEFTWAQLKEILSNRDIWSQLKLDNEIQNMRVVNCPPFVRREVQGGPLITSFPEGSMRCLESAWEHDENQQGDDGSALVFWSLIKSYAEGKSQRIQRTRYLIWAYFNNARLDARRYETQSFDNPEYEEEYNNAPIAAKGTCPGDLEDSIAASWFVKLPPLDDTMIGFKDYAAATRNPIINQRDQDVDLPRAKKATYLRKTPDERARQNQQLDELTRYTQNLQPITHVADSPVYPTYNAIQNIHDGKIKRTTIGPLRTKHIGDLGIFPTTRITFVANIIHDPRMGDNRVYDPDTMRIITDIPVVIASVKDGVLSYTSTSSLSIWSDEKITDPTSHVGKFIDVITDKFKSLSVYALQFEQKLGRFQFNLINLRENVVKISNFKHDIDVILFQNANVYDQLYKFFALELLSQFKLNNPANIDLIFDQYHTYNILANKYAYPVKHDPDNTTALDRLKAIYRLTYTYYTGHHVHKIVDINEEASVNNEYPVYLEYAITVVNFGLPKSNKILTTHVNTLSPNEVIIPIDPTYDMYYYDNEDKIVLLEPEKNNHAFAINNGIGVTVIIPKNTNPNDLSTIFSEYLSKIRERNDELYNVYIETGRAVTYTEGQIKEISDLRNTAWTNAAAVIQPIPVVGGPPPPSPPPSPPPERRTSSSSGGGASSSSSGGGASSSSSGGGGAASSSNSVGEKIDDDDDDDFLPSNFENWIKYHAQHGDILEEAGAYLILLPTDTRQLNEYIHTGRIDTLDYINMYTHRYPYGDSFAKHTRKLDAIEINGQKLVVRRNFNREIGRLELSIETVNGSIYTVPVTIYVDEPNRLIVSVPVSKFFKFKIPSSIH